MADRSKSKQILEVLEIIKNECGKYEHCEDGCEFWDSTGQFCFFTNEFPMNWDLEELR